ncbi:Hypothetical protein R9X50_00610300 [Acrodontium crateriforme]|uniref:RRM domain-containing protein n=1 Tax=Acrodontium crateriforme TaxID=150365 RepID=A0AAQ3RBE5_9PEZI|nr:Hypothetical protein R9X50_00610300 [Acrodontium crateriforme]
MAKIQTSDSPRMVQHPASTHAFSVSPKSTFNMNAGDMIATIGSARTSTNLAPNPSRAVSSPQTSASNQPWLDLLTYHHQQAALYPPATIIIRRLAPNTSKEALTSMLIFAGDLEHTEFIASPHPVQDRGFATAQATFRTQASAMEAQEKLHGKQNSTKDSTMIVEIYAGGIRRNTADGPRSNTSSASSSNSNAAIGGRSRFNSTFQSNERISPPLSSGTTVRPGDVSVQETSPRFFPVSDHALSTHPINHSMSNGFSHGLHHRSGKSMINDDSVDDETEGLIKDPVAYAENEHYPLARRPTTRHVSLSSGMGNLVLNTNQANGHAHTNGVSSHHPRGSISAVSPTSTPNGGTFQTSVRHQFPPINPADQNPPCNTLYVGNLPMDTSEDELKTLFSKQRGYKRLAVRQKPQGPMCFVEFEDISYATQTLHTLYGHLLHNSVRGGIRLSFSKNPLGVRTQQNNAYNNYNGAHSSMTHQTMTPGYSATTGPPPGLGNTATHANGLGSQNHPPGIDTRVANNNFGMAGLDMTNQMSPQAMAHPATNGTNNGVYAYSMANGATNGTGAFTKAPRTHASGFNMYGR